jgi:hypothetical protein
MLLPEIDPGVDGDNCKSLHRYPLQPQLLPARTQIAELPQLELLPMEFEKLTMILAVP